MSHNWRKNNWHQSALNPLPLHFQSCDTIPAAPVTIEPSGSYYCMTYFQYPSEYPISDYLFIYFISAHQHQYRADFHMNSRFYRAGPRRHLWSDCASLVCNGLFANSVQSAISKFSFADYAAYPLLLLHLLCSVTGWAQTRCLFWNSAWSQPQHNLIITTPSNLHSDTQPPRRQHLHGNHDIDQICYHF